VAQGPATPRRFTQTWDPAASRLARVGIAAPRDVFLSDVWVGLVLLAALAIRLVWLPHPLSIDEARTMIAIRDFVTHHSVTFYWSIHAPGYLLAVLPAAFATGASPTAVEFMGVIFSLAGIYLTWLLARELFDRDTALFAALAMAFMPLNGVYAGWIKQDALMTLFTLATVYLFVRGRWLWAAVTLALAIFTKEYALLLIPAMAAFTAATFQWGRTWRWLVTSAVAVGLSAWYFLLFGKTGGQFLEGFFGIGVEARSWGHPWWWYLARAPEDMGWVVTALVVTGLGYALWRLKHDDLGYVLLIAWAGVIWLVHSVGAVKGQWYLYQTTPPLAMLAGASAAWLVRLVRDPMRRKAACALLAAGIIVPALFVTHYRYTWDRSYGKGYVTAMRFGEILRRELSPGRVLFSTNTDPIVQYYSGLPLTSFSVALTTYRLDILKAVFKKSSFEGEGKDFLMLVRTQKWHWMVFQGFKDYPVEYGIARRAGGRVYVRGGWALVDLSPLYKSGTAQ
jgi:4-amino-4-deoxy-L-arabinose transferase-like glycosyltransferase